MTTERKIDSKQQTLEERETNIHFDETKAAAWVETHNIKLRNNLRKLNEERPDKCQLKYEDNDRGYARYYVPKNWVKIAPPRKVNLTDEQRDALRERLRNISHV